ncbi:M48 family metalloprotease [bacterium]|nr:M48 family metalloprotease [bacterium]
MKKPCLFLSSFLLVLLLSNCAVNPVSGKRELMLFSEEAEISMGEKSDQQIRNHYGVYKEEAINKYVGKIGRSLVPHTHRPQLDYHFAVLDTPVVNAFAVPGGYIYVTRGLLAAMNSEAQLALVLGHELGHVSARHSVSKMSQMLLVQVGMVVGSVLSEKFAEISGAAGIGIQLLFLKFSRDDEREADRLGVLYGRKGKYNPAKMIAFFKTLQDLGDLSEGRSLPGFLSTHPLTRERIQNTREMIAEKDSQLKIRTRPYLQRIQNLVFGSDPRQGYTIRHTFYHPNMSFAFSYPRRWKLQNTPSRVTMISEDEKAAMLLQTEETSSQLQEYAEKKVSEIQDKRLLGEKSLSINGLSSYQRIYEIAQEDKEDLRAQMCFIRYGPRIFTFTGLTTSTEFNHYDYFFEKTAGSFQRLKKKKYLNRQPRRIHLVKGDGKTSLKQMFQQAGMDQELWEKLAVMNDLELNQTPKPNQLIKVVK